MARTSIGLGGGEVVLVDIPLEEVAEMIRNSLVEETFFKVVDPLGETIFLNPMQVKILQEVSEQVGGKDG